MYALLQHSVTVNFARRTFCGLPVILTINSDNFLKHLELNQLTFVVEKCCIFFEAGTEIVNII
jgi:hypothetical protein